MHGGDAEAGDSSPSSPCSPIMQSQPCLTVANGRDKKGLGILPRRSTGLTP
jgi:hypothetical protein